MGNIIREEQPRAAKLEHSIDLFFPKPTFVKVLAELMRISQMQFASSEIREPFNVSVLGSVEAINPEAVSIDDILRMRNE